MPEISRFYGIIVKMFYDDHNPPHFHVEYQDFEAIIYIHDGRVKGEMPRKQLKYIYSWLDEHQDELLANWELSTQREPLHTIEPHKK